MSLCLLDDPHSSLEAALAFLDSCDDDDAPELGAPYDVSFDLDALLDADDVVLDSPTSNHENISSATHSSSSGVSVQQAVVRSVEKRQQATRKHKTTLPAAPRRRTRTDILELREQVIQLTARIDRLNKRTRVQPSMSGFHADRIANRARLPLLDVKDSSIQLAGVVLEREKLREAESLNAKLKVAWRRQLKLCQQLETVFKKKLTPADVESLFVTRSTAPIHDSAMLRSNSLVLVNLSHCLEKLYDQAAVISASISMRDTTRVCSSSHVHYNALQGDVFEFTTNTPLDCELPQLEKEVWSMLSSGKKSKQKPQVVSHDTRELTTSHHEHQFTRKFDCQFGSIYVNGVSVIRKFVEPHRVVIVYTSTLALAGTELTFREIGWLILLQVANTSTAVSKIAQPSALLQTSYRMYPDKLSAASRTPDTPYFENFILQSHCETMRTHQLHLQSDLFAQFGFAATPKAAARAQLDPFLGCYDNE